MPDTFDRFMAKVEIDPSGCWLWTGAKTRGYGCMRVARVAVYAHRWSWEYHTGRSIPDGFHIDHLCRTPACVNPSHLEPVAPRTNTLRGIGPTAQRARQTACIHGHELTPENTWIRKEGWRQCRSCKRRRDRESLKRKASVA